MDGLTRYRGDTLRFGCVYRDDEGTPQDITGYQILFKLATITHSSDGVSIIRDDPNGAFLVIVSAALMAALTENAYNFEVVFIDPSGIKEHLFVKRLTILDGA